MDYVVYFDATRRTLPGFDILLTKQRCIRCPSGKVETGGAWLSSARVVRCWVKSRNERNPYCQLLRKRTLARLPLTKRRKVGMTSNHHALYDLGYTRTTMALNKEKRDREVEQNSETTSQFGLQAATRLHEVGIASNRGSACHGEYVPGPCTHRPSHHESWEHPKSVV